MKSRVLLFSLSSIALLMPLAACSTRTHTAISTVYDVGFKLINAGNHPITEWGEKPADYEEYFGVYVSSYRYELKHDGTVRFDAVYRFHRKDNIEGYFEEHELGVYHATKLGPNQTISITLNSREATLTWEPNPRDPTGDLVFRLWEKRTTDYGFVDDEHPGKTNATVYYIFASEYIAPGPL